MYEKWTAKDWGWWCALWTIIGLCVVVAAR
jgi:hypothetical protein